MRLLAAGLAGAGTLAYSLLPGGGGGDDTQAPSPPPPPSEGKEEEESAPSHPQPESQGGDEDDTIVVIASEEEEQPEINTQIAPSPPDVVGERQEEERGIVVDSHQVLGLIEDVLSKTGEQMLQENTNALQKQQQERTEAAQVAITTAISDNVGESVTSDIVKASHGITAMTPTTTSAQSIHPRPPPPPSQPPPPLPERVVIEKETLENVLGIKDDSLMTASGLIAASHSTSWDDYDARHRQAVADAAALSKLLNIAAEHVKRELKGAEEARSQALAQAERFRNGIKEALRQAEEGHALAMRQQAETLVNAHAEATVRERAERQARLDDLRLKLGALERALEQRSDALRGGTVAHRLAQGAFMLQDALARGRSVDSAAEFVASVASKDELIQAAVTSLPRGTPIQTPTQLADAWGGVEAAARELSALPAGQGGMLSALVAKLAAKLKIKEHVDGVNGGGDGIDGKLANVERALVSGKLVAAADALEKAVKGTAAEQAVVDWVRAARARAAAEQAVAVVEAHAATAAVSLSL